MTMIASCGGGSNTEEVINTEYNGIGSNWSATFNSDNTCSLTESTASISVNCNYEDVASGFRKVTVTSASGSGAPSAGDVLYSLNIPGYAFVFKPTSGDSIVPMVSAGNCPAAPLSSNYVMVQGKTNNVGDAFTNWGVFGVLNQTAITGNQQSGTYNLDIDRYQADGTSLGNSDAGVLSCSSGITNYSNAGTTVRAYLTSGSGMVIEVRADTGRYERHFSLAQETAFSDITAVDGNYSGYMFTGNGDSGHVVTSVVASIANGSISVAEINPGTNAVGSSVAGLSLSLMGNNGEMQGTVTTVDGASGIGCAVDIDAGGSTKNFIACSGMQPGTSDQSLLGLMLISGNTSVCPSGTVPDGNGNCV